MDAGVIYGHVASKDVTECLAMSEELIKLGRPEKIPNRNKVIRLAAKGLIQEEIASLTGVCVDTLVKHCSEELKRGALLCNSSLRSKQVRKALKGDTTMLIWLGKNRLDQADKQEIDVRKQVTVQMIVGIGENDLNRLTNGYHGHEPLELIQNTSTEEHETSQKESLSGTVSQ